MKYERFLAFWKNALIVGFAVLGVMYLANYGYSSIYGQAKSMASTSSVAMAHQEDPDNPQSPQEPDDPVNPPQEPNQQDPEQQNPDQPPPPSNPEADKYCERPDPNGDPNVGGTDHDKIGCTCMRKCNPNTGQPIENYENDKRCKVHCKPDHCKCPNPCES